MLGALSALAVLLAIGAPAAMAQNFSTPVDLSATGSIAEYPQVAIGSDGATTVVWYRSNGTNTIIQAATRPAGSATFDTPADLSATGQNASQPQIAIGPDGATTIVWQRSNGTNNIIQTATRPAGSATFSTPADLSATGQNASIPRIAIGPDGATTIVWQRFNGSNTIIQTATRPAGSATFGTPADLSATGQDALSPQVAIGPDGATTVVWYRYNAFSIQVVQAATRPAGSATFGAAVDLSTGLGAIDPQIAVGPDGGTTVIWGHNNGTYDVVQAATRPAGSATFGTPDNISATGGNAEYPQVAVGPDGAPTIVWPRFVGSNSVIQASTGDPALVLLLLTVTRSGVGSGTVTSSPAGIECGATCSATVPIGSSVTLTAVPATGSAFFGWSGGCAGTTTTCTLQMTAATSVSAEFSLTSATTPTTAATTAPTVNVKKTTRTIGASAIMVTSSVVANQAGTITQRVVRRGGTAQTLCTTSRKVSKAGTYTLTCTLGRSVRNQLHTEAIRYTLVTTFTDRAGVQASTRSNGRLARIPIRPAPPEAVTG